jgi:hypothetical protein
MASPFESWYPDYEEQTTRKSRLFFLCQQVSKLPAATQKKLRLAYGLPALLGYQHYSHTAG